MIDREKIAEGLEQAKNVIERWVPMFEQYNSPAVIDEAIALLKEQDAEVEYCERCGRVRLKSKWEGAAKRNDSD